MKTIYFDQNGYYKMNRYFFICFLILMLYNSIYGQNYLYNANASGLDASVTRVSSYAFNFGCTYKGITSFGFGVVNVPGQNDFLIFNLSVAGYKKQKEAGTVTIPISLSFSKLNVGSIYTASLGWYEKTMHKPTFGTVFGASLLYTSGSALDKGQFSVGLEMYFMIHAFKIGPSLVLVSENFIVGLTGGFALNHLGRRYQ